MPLRQGILVVDSDAKLRAQILSTLSPFDLPLYEAHNTEEGLNIYRAHKPSLVFVGTKAKGAELSFINQLVTLDSNAAVVVMVGSRTSTRLILEAIKLGVREFISRPMAPGEIKAVLSRFLLSAKDRARSTFPIGTVKKVEFELEVASHAATIASSVRLISNLLSGILERRELVRIELGIDEALRNAYEHGNLYMSGDEKRVFCESDALEEELRARESQADAEGRLIRIKVKCDPNEFNCLVEDQGTGFNWRQAQNTASQALPSLALHGRGLKLINAIFDSISFNEKGNMISLAKKFR